MERELVRLLPYILGGVFGLGLLLFLLSLYLLRLRRTGAHWRQRRKAGDRGGRLFVLSVGMMVASVALAVVTGLASLAVRNVSDYLNRGPDDLYGIVLPPEPAQTETREALAQASTATREQVEMLTPTSTLEPTRTLVPPTFTLTPTLTPTETQMPTATVTILPLLNLTADFNVTPRPAPEDFILRLVAVTDSTDSITDGTPEAQAAEQVAVFPAGVRRVYLVIAYDHMENGVAWSRVLFRDDVAVQGNTLLWSLGSNGGSAFFFGDDAGYEAGEYEARLYVGSQEASRLRFTVEK